MGATATMLFDCQTKPQDFLYGFYIVNRDIVVAARNLVFSLVIQAGICTMPTLAFSGD
jgi:hypothetical protein